MVSGIRVPDRGDIVWIDLDPRTGREQSGKRPALVLSPAKYNEAASLAVMLPITNQIKKYPFEVVLPKGLITSGAVLCDQIKSLDWKARNAEFKEKVPADVLSEVLGKLNTLLK